MADESRPTVTVKLKPYLQDYVKSRLNICQVAFTDNCIGVSLRLSLAPIPKGKIPEYPKNKNYMTIPLPYYKDLNIRHRTFYVPDFNQPLLEKAIDRHFKDLFFNWMDDKLRYDTYVDGKVIERGQIKLRILEFCDFYDISFDHLNYDLLKKKYYRYRMKRLLSKINNSR